LRWKENSLNLRSQLPSESKLETLNAVATATRQEVARLAEEKRALVAAKTRPLSLSTLSLQR
jgi:hypothetical protein